MRCGVWSPSGPSRSYGGGMDVSEPVYRREITGKGRQLKIGGFFSGQTFYGLLIDTGVLTTASTDVTRRVEVGGKACVLELTSNPYPEAYTNRNTTWSAVLKTAPEGEILGEASGRVINPLNAPLMDEMYVRAGRTF